MDAPTLYGHIQNDERVPAKYRRLAKPIDEATSADVFRLKRAGLEPTEEAKNALYDPVENPKDEATVYLASGETRTFESVKAARDAFERGDISRGTYDKVMARFRGLDGGPASEAVGDSTETSGGSTDPSEGSTGSSGLKSDPTFWPGKTITASVKFANESIFKSEPAPTEPKAYRGNIVVDPPAANKITVGSYDVTVPPGETITKKFTITVPNSLEVVRPGSHGTIRIGDRRSIGGRFYNERPSESTGSTSPGGSSGSTSPGSSTGSSSPGGSSGTAPDGRVTTPGISKSEPYVTIHGRPAQARISEEVTEHNVPKVKIAGGGTITSQGLQGSRGDLPKKWVSWIRNMIRRNSGGDSSGSTSGDGPGLELGIPEDQNRDGEIDERFQPEPVGSGSSESASGDSSGIDKKTAAGVLVAAGAAAMLLGGR